MPRNYRRTFGTNFKKYFHICKHCPIGFSSSRPDSEYCSPKCREAARRGRVVAELRKQEAEAARKIAAEVAAAKSKRHKKAAAKPGKRKTKARKR